MLSSYIYTSMQFPLKYAEIMILFTDALIIDVRVSRNAPKISSPALKLEPEVGDRVHMSIT